MGRPLRAGARILVRLPSWLGDVVQSEPVVRALCDGVGASSLALAGPGHLLDVFEGRFPGARRIPHVGRGAEVPRDWAENDVALLLTGSFRSAWTAWRAGIPRRVGWSRDGRGLLLTDGLRPSLERGGLPLGLGRPGGGRRYLPRSFTATCVELVGLLGIAVPDARPRLAPTERGGDLARVRLESLGLGPSDPYLLASVGSRPGSAKGFPPGSWAGLLDGLSELSGLPAVLVAGPGEEESAAAVASRAGRARPLVSLDPPIGLPELIALCGGARLVVSADSGPRHLATAAGAPVVCVFGPTDPRHGVDGLEPRGVVRIEVPCGPCHLERCPIRGDGEHACMRGVDPASLVEPALEVLGRVRGG